MKRLIGICKDEFYSMMIATAKKSAKAILKNEWKSSSQSSPSAFAPISHAQHTLTNEMEAMTLDAHRAEELIVTAAANNTMNGMKRSSLAVLAIWRDAQRLPVKMGESDTGLQTRA